MADRTVTTRLRLDTSAFTSGAVKASGSMQNLSRQMTETGATAAAMRQRLEAATKALPQIKIDADSTAAEVKFAQIRRQLETLAGKRIGIDVDAGAAMAEIAGLERELQQLQRNEASIDVRADIGTALAELRAVQSEVGRIDGQTANVKVNADVSGALAGIGMVVAALAAIPAASSIGVGVAGLGAAFSAAGVGAAAFGAATIPALGRVNEALQQQETAAGGAGGATKSLAQTQAQAASTALGLATAQDRVTDAAKKVKTAQEGVKDSLAGVKTAQQAVATAQADVSRAVQDGAARHVEALRRVEDAERSVAAAQKDSLRAQQDLNDARKQAARDAQDTASRLAGSQIDMREAVLDAADAEKKLAAVQANEKSTPEAIERATIARDRANQRVKDLQTSLERLNETQAENTRTGVEGSRQVVAAKDAVAAAAQRVLDAERSVSDAQANVAKVDADSAARVAAAQRGVAQAHRDVAEAQKKVLEAQQKVIDSQRDATRAAQALKVQQLQAKAAMDQAGGGASGAATKMSKLSKAERDLAKDIKGSKKAYEDWQKSLESSTFPVITGALELMTSQLPRITPLVKASAGAFTSLEKDAKKALTDPIWDEWIGDLTTHIPVAIEGLGHTAGNVFKGIAGVIDAFLPTGDKMIGLLETGSKRFADWGEHLKGSPEFQAFMAYVAENAPKVGEVIGNIAEVVGKILKAGSGGGSGVLDLIVGLSEKLASLSPDQIQAIAAGVGAIWVSMNLGKSVKMAALLALAELIPKLPPAAIYAIAGAVAALKTAMAIKDAAQGWSELPGLFGKGGDAASTAKGKFSGLGGTLKTLGGATLIGGLVIGVGELDKALSGLNPDIDKLAKGMGDFVKGAKPGPELLDQLQGKMSLIDPRGLKGIDDVVSGMTSNHWWDKLDTGIGNTLNTLGGGAVVFDHGAKRLENIDQAMAKMVQSGNADGAAKMFAGITQAAKDSGTPLSKLRDLFPEYSSAANGGVTPTHDIGIAMQDAAGAVAKVAEKLGDFQGKLDTFNGKTDAARVTLELRQAFKDAKKAIDDAGGSMSTTAGKTDEQKDAIIRARDQFATYIGKVNDAASAAGELAKKNGDSAGSADAAKEAFVRQIPDLVKLAGKSKEARDLINGMAVKFGITKTEADKAAEGIKGVNDVVANMKSKSIKITAEVFYEQAKKTAAARDSADGNIFMSRGGVTSFAGGAENHVAQVAPAGAWRVWAEPETGGEAYIPLASGKRQRSTAILSDVAGRFGYELVPAAGAIRQANGGLVVVQPGASSSAAGASGLGAAGDKLSSAADKLSATSSQMLAAAKSGRSSAPSSSQMLSDARDSSTVLTSAQDIPGLASGGPMVKATGAQLGALWRAAAGQSAASIGSTVVNTGQQVVGALGMTSSAMLSGMSTTTTSLTAGLTSASSTASTALTQTGTAVSTSLTAVSVTQAASAGTLVTATTSFSDAVSKQVDALKKQVAELQKALTAAKADAAKPATAKAAASGAAKGSNANESSKKAASSAAKKSASSGISASLVKADRVVPQTMIAGSQASNPNAVASSNVVTHWAAGGVDYGPMVATQPRAVFGEAGHPEAFIPYDPSMRGRAMGLVSQVAGDLGMTRTPTYQRSSPAVTYQRGSGGSGGDAGAAFATAAKTIVDRLDSLEKVVAKAGVTINGQVIHETADADVVSAKLAMRMGGRG